MKFGKYLESRQLELPEYVGHFINYKALKKLIKALALPNGTTGQPQDVERALQENKTSFFFRLERELEKVNSFYLEKESDLKIRLDILVKKKNDAIAKNRLGSKTCIAYMTLYDGFKRFSRDLDRLEQFVELNQTGFSKVLKKWDKRSKSHTKELYLSKAVSVQPVFNRAEISNLSDLCANSLVELDAKTEGEQVVRFDYEQGNELRHNSITYSDISNLQLKPSTKSLDKEKSIHTSSVVDDFEIDELYSEFLNIAHSSTVNDLLVAFIERIKETPNPGYKLTKIFFLAIPTKITDEILSLFYKQCSGLVALKTTDDLSQRTVVHEACCNVNEERTFIVQLAIEGSLNLHSKDISGRTPLHYAAELGRTDLIKLLCTNTGVLEHLNSLDYDSMSPLLLAIDKNHLDSVRSLLELGADAAPTNTESHPQYLPLNVACKSGNYEAAELLLEQPKVKDFQKDAEGLLPLHVVAKTGNFKLVPLLTQNGADPNGLDSFNKWPPIFYSASEGHPRTTAALIKAGAHIEIKDEENNTPLYYSTWEGHVNVLNVLIDAIQRMKGSSNLLSPLKVANRTMSISPDEHSSAFSLGPVTFNIDSIPDLSLPPPIIPLRRYGHNFLEKKIFLQLHFALGKDSIVLNQDEIITSLPGRIVLSSRISDVVPRNILLPVIDGENTVAFQIDSLDMFSIDFEIFPSFGTKLIAKTSALSYVFTNVTNDGLNNSVVLPLFDSRLKNVGELKFQFQVIHPYSGTPLEITKYDTYWKSTSGNNTRIQNSVLSFVTASSLSGDYVKINISLLADGTPIVCPTWNLDIMGTKLPLYQLSFDQLKTITNYNMDSIIFPDVSDTSSKQEFYAFLKGILDNNYILFDDFLRLVPDFVNLNVEVLYPTEAEVKDIPMTLPDTTDLDEFIDSVLTTVFDHVRQLRSNNVKRTRSLVFSSNNQSVCSILNWKQPNYPVFFNVSGVHFEGDRFNVSSANGFSVDVVKSEDAPSHSLKEATRFATLNNLLGIIVPSELLVLVPDLVDSIKFRGLVLVASKNGMKISDLPDENLAKTDINGARWEDILSFKGDIDM